MKRAAVMLLLALTAFALAGRTLCPETGETIPSHVLNDPNYSFQQAVSDPEIRDVGQWSGTGPWGGNIRSLITDPANPLHVFAAAGFNLATTVGGVYSSTDGGINWQAANLPGKPYYALAASASEPGTFYAGARNGLYKSTDNGASWNAAGLSTTFILSLGVNPLSGNNLIVGKSGNVGIVVSTDGGASFGQVGVNGGFMREFAWSAANPQRMFIVMGSASSSVLSSVDGGASWSPYGPSGDGWGMYVSPTDSLFSLVAHASGIYRSTDGGQNWTLEESGTFRSVIGYNGIFYATSNAGGVYESNDGGQTWQPYNTGVVQSTWQAGTASGSGALLGHWGGIFRATGYQQPILVSHTGINAAFLHGLAYYADSGELWAGGEGSGLYRSVDGGQTWEQRVNGLNNWMIYELQPTNHQYYQSGRMLAGTLSGAYTSLDGGNTWSYLHYEGVQVSALELHPTDPDKFWIGTSIGEIKYTDDGGQSWTTCTGGFFGFAPRLKLGKGPLGNWRLFLCFQGSATAVWYSDDGISFVSSTGLEGTTYQPMVAIRPTLGAQSQIVYASTDTGIFKSTDNGASFSSAGMSGFSWSVISGPGQQVISGKDNGLSYSTDEGATSSSLTQNIAGTTVWALAWGGSTNQTYISTRGKGVMENRFSSTEYGLPTQLQATPGDQQMTLAWSAPTGTPAPIAYLVWRDAYPVAQVADTTSWTDTGLINGQSYKYSVTALYGDGIHTSVTQIITAIPAIPANLPPTDVTATVADNDVTISWTAPAAKDRMLISYNIYRDNVLYAQLPAAFTSYTDYDLPNGDYLYGVQAVHDSGESGIVTVNATVNVVSVEDPQTPALATALLGNRPNPCFRQTRIAFSLKEPAWVEIAIYDARGRLVRSLVNEAKDAGIHNAVWDGSGGDGAPLSRGIYLYKMISGTYSKTGKLILLK